MGASSSSQPDASSSAHPKVRRLPLHEKHIARGARFGAFGDWEVPLYYTSILEEHEAVRTRAGLFDISHMGEFFVRGREAVSFLQGLLPRDIPSLSPGAASYMPLLNERGGIVDDVILYRFHHDQFLLIVNAANIDKDAQWIRARVPRGVEFQNVSEEKGLLALQGPGSAAILEGALAGGFSGLDYYRFREWGSGMIARTGYTGEDGFEIMADLKDLAEIWDRLFGVGATHALPAGRQASPLLVPAGFGARDTLRVEAGMLLYGHDMSDDRTPIEAGIGWTVDLNKKNFVGREALLKQRKKGPKQKLVGFEMIERGIPRQDCAIQKGGRPIGKVTSGSFVPTLQKNVGLGYVPAAEAQADNEIEIMIREKPVKAKIVKLPFYKRRRN